MTTLGRCHEGKDRQTDTRVLAAMPVCEVKENRSHQDALVLLQTAGHLCLGKGLAARDPPAKPGAGPVPPAASPVLIVNLCPR